jgi:hypothetical protein
LVNLNAECKGQEGQHRAKNILFRCFQTGLKEYLPKASQAKVDVIIHEEMRYVDTLTTVKEKYIQNKTAGCCLAADLILHTAMQVTVGRLRTHTDHCTAVGYKLYSHNG